MFSGLITSVGTFVGQKKNRWHFRAQGIKAKLGDSIAVNGVCLTVAQVSKGKETTLSFDLSKETVQKTTLKYVKAGSRVNLEPALKMSDALGGHLVQGHVDGIGTVSKIESHGNLKNITFAAPSDIMECVVSKGSIAVDGVSLTSIAITPKGFSVALIPFTLEHTNLASLKRGDKVNLEADIIGKYVQSFLRKR